jgi:hypothetical protein
MGFLRNTNFWIGVAVGFFAVPFALKTFRA